MDVYSITCSASLKQVCWWDDRGARNALLREKSVVTTNKTMMLVLCSCVTALQMGPLLPSNDPLRMAAPITAAEIWVEPPNINLMTESLEQGVASSRGSVPMIFWKSMPLSQTGSEAPPPYGASTGVASWYAHAHVL